MLSDGEYGAPPYKPLVSSSVTQVLNWYESVWRVFSSLEPVNSTCPPIPALVNPFEEVESPSFLKHSYLLFIGNRGI
jgi:hypothetical protein